VHPARVPHRRREERGVVVRARLTQSLMIKQTKLVGSNYCSAAYMIELYSDST
jgi:hypothetical protein